MPSLSRVTLIQLPSDSVKAAEMQRTLRRRLTLSARPDFNPRYIAAVDVAYDRERAYGAAVVVDIITQSAVNQATHSRQIQARYQPGLFSLREADLSIGVLCKLTTMPDLILVDGHGIAHPQHFGLACHIGLVLDVPTLGCAKTPLLPLPIPMLGLQRGSTCAVLDNEGHEVGAVVRTQDGVNPVYVSPGNHLDVQTATTLALDLAPRYRLPEPLRLAHHLSIMFRSTQGNSPSANQ